MHNSMPHECSLRSNYTLYYTDTISGCQSIYGNVAASMYPHNGISYYEANQLHFKAIKKKTNKYQNGCLCYMILTPQPPKKCYLDQLLSLPSSSASVERLFSKAGILLSQRCTRVVVFALIELVQYIFS